MAAKSRPHQYAFRLKTEETWELWELVQRSGLSQQEYLRRRALEQRIMNTDGIKLLIPELKRIGSNLNQVARSCNQGHQATRAEVEEIRKELGEVWQQLKRFLQSAE